MRTNLVRSLFSGVINWKSIGTSSEHTIPDLGGIGASPNGHAYPVNNRFQAEKPANIAKNQARSQGQCILASRSRKLLSTRLWAPSYLDRNIL